MSFDDLIRRQIDKQHKIIDNGDLSADKAQRQYDECDSKIRFYEQQKEKMPDIKEGLI